MTYLHEVEIRDMKIPGGVGKGSSCSGFNMHSMTVIIPYNRDINSMPDIIPNNRDIHSMAVLIPYNHDISDNDCDNSDQL